MSNSIKILFTLLFFVSMALGQNLKCTYCNKEITGKYIVVDGKPYHKNHFKCANCGKTITGNYYKKNGNYYDKNCFEKLFMPKCAVCNKPINGEYYTDLYGMKIHKYHENELPRCDNCNRIISERTTHGGVKYKDGRNICNLCYAKKLSTQAEYEKSLKKVVARLSNYKLKFDVENIKLKIVNLKELQKISGNKYSKSIQGFTKTKIEYFFGKKTYTHTIYILSDIPAKYAESTIAHELMHTWLSKNIKNKLSPQLEEGSCNYISYTYLKSDYSEDAKNIIKQLKHNPDKIYGDGFRKVYNRFVGRDFGLFIEYLKKHSNI
jgi:hypothetical protein